MNTDCGHAKQEIKGFGVLPCATCCNVDQFRLHGVYHIFGDPSTKMIKSWDGNRFLWEDHAEGVEAHRLIVLNEDGQNRLLRPEILP